MRALGTPMNRFWRAFDRPALITSLILGIVPTTVLVIAAGYPALQDFGGWLYQGRVLAWIWTGHSSAFTLAPYPVPYSLAQAALGSLNLLFAPIAAALVYLGLYLVLGAVAISLFVRRYHLSPILTSAFLTVTVVLGSAFWNGYVGTSLGAALLVLYLALDRRAMTSWGGVLAASLVMFFTHAIAFAVWGLVALVLAIATRRLWRFVLGIIPALALIAWYAASSTQAATSTVTPSDVTAFLGYKAYTLVKFGGYQNFIAHGVGDFSRMHTLYIVGIGVNVLFVAALVLAVVRLLATGRRQISTHRAEAVALLALLVVMAVLPQFAFGIVNPGERIGPAALTLLALFVFPAGDHRRWTQWLLAVTLVVGLALAVTSAALLPSKSALDVSHTANDTASTAHSLLGHRTDELRAAVEAAQQSWRAGTEPRFPLVWQTSMLLQPTSHGLAPWTNPYGSSLGEGQ